MKSRFEQQTQLLLIYNLAALGSFTFTKLYGHPSSQALERWLESSTETSNLALPLLPTFMVSEMIDQAVFGEGVFKGGIKLK